MLRPLPLACFFLFVLSLFALRCNAAESIDFAQVQAILEAKCSDCHSGDERNGGLQFDVPATVFGQADSGDRAVVPGDSSASQLIRRLESGDEDLRMPPDGEPLSGEEIKLLRNWIDEGASWPEQKRSTSAGVTSSHWAFQPIARPTLPEVDDICWSKNPIDRFVHSEREARNLQAVHPANAIALIRRVTYGLTGMPPTADEVEHFVTATQGQGADLAMQQLVDRLLNSPQYGERWGRHWMDWVRYADTAGDNSDFPIPQAYLYRNYIIDSLNTDLPYDRFVTEQIAGDLLPAETTEERNRQTIATGYLAMARRFGSLVERYPWHLTIEDTIDNVGRTMMGLTLSCARCHDHKFDPISTRDYYGMYGIFASTRYPFPGIELFQTQHDLVSLLDSGETQRLLEPFAAKTRQLEDELERLLANCERRAQENAAREATSTIDQQRKDRDELDALLLKARKAGTDLADHLKTIPEYATAYAVQDATPVDADIQIKGEPTRPGASVPRRFPEILGGYTLPDDVAQSESGRLQLAQWIANSDNPLTARVIVNRVWQRHFGTGLVSSTSDFGLRGTEPSHPDLLDWLATNFMENGWSLKHLHRLIMTSQTYQLASAEAEANVRQDPANRYLWKFSRQRLDAESLRDTLLALSGELDPTPQSEPYPFPPKAKWEYTQHHPFKDDFASNKRSVYLMTKRLTAKPYFQTFDGPDPNVCTSDRDESVTPLQALYFANDDFFHQQSQSYAAELVRRFDSDAHRAAAAVREVLCRTATDEELQWLVDHAAAVRRRLGPQADSVAIWSSVTRSLLRTNEFLYID